MVGAVIAATVIAAAGGASAAPAGARQSGNVLWSATTPGAATGSTFDVRFTNPEHRGEKPHTVNRIVVHYPAGTVFDSHAAPQCHASDAQLEIEGPSACPADSKLGGGLAVSDTGSSGPFPPRYTKSTISQFNGDHELIGVGVNQDIPAIKTVTHTRFNGTTASTDFPTFPGMGPPDNYTPLKSLEIDFSRRVRNGHASVRTPPTCPRSGYWTIATDFTYVDGVTQAIESHSPCRAGSKPTPDKHKRPKHHQRNRGWHRTR